VDSSASKELSLLIQAASGEIVGTFMNPDSHTNFIESVILQNTNYCGGYFYETNQAGATTQVGSFILIGN